MSSVRRKGFMVSAAIAALISACGGAGRLASDAPAAVDLAGIWRLDRAASDDPQKAIDQLRSPSHREPDAGHDLGDGDDGQTGDEGTDGGPTTGQPAGRHGGSHRSNGGAGPPSAGGPSLREDAYQRASLAHVLMSDATRSDQVIIRQAPDSFVLDYGTSVRSFTPGGHSVVSVEGGVADQQSGWKGKEYVIEVKPQIGPHVVERYGLSEDGKQLIQNLRVGGSGLPVIQLKRVYDRSDTVLPRATPTSD
jgi:hypothetical protein